MNVDRSQVGKILVIKLRAIGDVLLSTIVTKNLRLAFPHARIDYLTETPSAGVLKNNPFIDQTLTFNRTRMGGSALIRMVSRNNYDMVIDLFGNPRTALITKLSGARFRVGYRFRGRTYAYNIVVEPRGAEVHNTEFNLDALRAIDVDIHDRNIHFQFSSDDVSRVDTFLSRAGIEKSFMVGLNSGGGWYTKRWGLDRFAQLGDRIHDRYGASIILLWGPGQEPDVAAITSQMQHAPFIPPPTTLNELGALLNRCSLVVSNDSGPMHIAAAVGTPVLGIFGPTDPTLQGPLGENHLVVQNEQLECLGCNLTECPIGHPCMLDLSVDQVMASVGELITKNRLIS